MWVGGDYIIIQITAGHNLVADVSWSTMPTTHSPAPVCVRASARAHTLESLREENIFFSFLFQTFFFFLQSMDEGSRAAGAAALLSAALGKLFLGLRTQMRRNVRKYGRQALFFSPPSVPPSFPLSLLRRRLKEGTRRGKHGGLFAFLSSSDSCLENKT